MSTPRLSGYWIVIMTMTLAAAIGAWSLGASLHPSPVVRVLTVLLMGALLLSLRGLLTGTWQWVARQASARDTRGHVREAAARVGAAHTPVVTRERRWLEAFTDEMKDRHGWRWRYRQPWLLLMGNGKTIRRLLPELARQGYLATDDLVLLWQANDAHDQPDTAGLKSLARYRRRRPVDGVVMVINGVEDTFASPHRAPAFDSHLTRIARALHWSAPVYVVDVAQVEDIDEGHTPVVGIECHPSGDTKRLEAALLALRNRLADVGVQRLGMPSHDTYAAKLSERLDTRAKPLAGWLAGLLARRTPVQGAYFTPFPSATETYDAALIHALPPLWAHLSTRLRQDRGRRMGSHPLRVACLIALGLLGLTMVGMLVTAVAQNHALHQSHALLEAVNHGDEAARLRSLLAVQQRIEQGESQVTSRGSQLIGFGLRRDHDLLAALWARYAAAARKELTAPVQGHLEAALAALGSTRDDALESHEDQRRHYDQLKAYLMLAEPSRTEASFLSDQIAKAWPAVTTMPPGEWHDTAPRLARFFASHLAAHPELRLAPDMPLIAAARTALITQMGLAQADDTIYASVLDSARGKYADVSLPSLLHGTDAHGLFSTSVTVPGIYSRAAWEGRIAEAIDQAAKERHVEGDNVLTERSMPAESAGPTAATPQAVDALKQRLTARYFAEYTAAWQRLLNSLQWQPATNLNTAIDQLTRLTDPQVSPLIALMHAVQYQAQAGRPSQAVGDSLVRTAQGLMGKREEERAAATVSPLDPSFGPLLALMGEDEAAHRDRTGTAHAAVAASEVSLQSYLTAATTMRLRLQQISGTPDAQATARALAQAVFQGKLSDLAQAREQAALTGASLGAAWAGFGRALFTQPLDSAWETILEPSAASLNELWRASIAAPFNSAFDGRYPFYASQADASFAELGRYVRPTSGLLPRFLTNELAGVLSEQGDGWVPNGLAPQSLTVDPAFLAAIQQMAVLGARLYTQGDAGMQVDILPQPTPNVTRSTLTIDRQSVVYFNQQESWVPITWPGDGLNGHVALSWTTLDGHVREVFDATGDWAFLRLLAQAEVTPLDSSRYDLRWRPPEAETVHVVMRTQVGAGPLELLKLRGFKLPERIFVLGRHDLAPVVPPRRTAP